MLDLSPKLYIPLLFDQMKKNAVRYVAYVLVVAIPFWFGSCKKDSDDAVTPTSASIVGTWKMSSYKVSPAYDLFGIGQPITDLLAFLKALPNNAGADAAACLTETTLTFKADGKTSSVAGSKCASSIGDQSPIEDNATWKLEGNKLTTVSGNHTDVYTVVSTGNTLKLTQSMDEDTNNDGKPETYTLTVELIKA